MFARGEICNIHEGLIEYFCVIILSLIIVRSYEYVPILLCIFLDKRPKAKYVNMLLLFILIVSGLLKAFLGNGSLNTFQRAIMEDVPQWTNVIARC
jgi:hypothetical protein